MEEVVNLYHISQILMEKVLDKLVLTEYDNSHYEMGEH